MQSLPENQVAMTTLVYHYFISEQRNNLFQLLNNSKNVEFLSVKCVAYLEINRVDLAKKCLEQIKTIEEDSCLVTLCEFELLMDHRARPCASRPTTGPYQARFEGRPTKAPAKAYVRLAPWKTYY